MRRIVLLLACVSAVGAETFFADDPVAKWPAPRHTTTVQPRRINEYYDFFQNIMFRPGELAGKSGSPIPARAVNTLGEAPDSEWYTNRHYHRRMSADELMRGPGNAAPPSMKQQWRVVSAKNEGITPGFTIVDAEGRRYVLKFDPPGNPEMASAADVISSKFFYALGYNVPENYIVRFRPGQLTIDSNAKFTDHYGKRRAMTDKDLREVMAKVAGNGGGEIRALASRFIPGTPVGPFRFNGTRSDDPNDTVPHEHRRDLRGLRVFASWLGHDDSKSLNTLDTLVKDDGTVYVKHYLIDFGASLGSASYGPNSPRSGNDYLFQWGPAAKQFMSLGFAIPAWARAKFPEIPAVGAFEYELFDAERWVPEYPNSAFSNMDAADAFWAARQVMAFTDDDIRAIVSTGEYSDERAADWVVRCLIERRNKIGRAFLTRTPALDRFAVRDRRLEFEDLAAKHFRSEQQYVVRWSAFDNSTGEQHAVLNAGTFEVPERGAEYVVAEIRADRGGPGVRVYVRNGRDVVGWETIVPAPQLLTGR
jgi:hypothetical protein